MADSLLQAINLLKEDNKTHHRESTILRTALVENTKDSNKILSELLSEIKISREDAREAQLDESNKKEKEDKQRLEEKKMNEGFELKGILQILAGVGAAVAGLAVGLVQGLKNIVAIATRSFRARISNMFAPFTRFIDAISDVFGKRGSGQIFKGNTYKSLGRLTGFFRSFADGIKVLETRFATAVDKFKSFARFVRSFAGMITNTVSSVARLGIDKLMTTVRSGMSSIGSFFKTVAGSASTFGEIRRNLPDLKAFRELKRAISGPFQAFFRGITGVSQNISQLGTVSKGFAKLGSVLGKIFGAFKIVGRYLAFPLTIIMGVIDGFKGMMAGAERQEGLFNKLIGGALGAIGGVISGLVMMPLDLIKDLISWAASKLGFDNFSAMLDSFSFVDQFKAMVNSLTDGVIALFHNLKNSIMRPFEDGFSFGGLIEFVFTIPHKIVAGALDFMKNMVSSILTLFGADESAAALDGFSFVDTLDNLIDWVKSLPGMLIDKIVEFAEGFDIGAALESIGDFATAATNQLKKMIGAILPDPDSLLAKVIPDALYEWTGTPVPPPPETVADALNRERAKDQEDRNPDLNPDRNPERKEKTRVDLARDRVEFARNKLEEDPTNEARMKILKSREDRLRDLERREAAIADIERRRPEAPEVTSRTSAGQEVVDKSKENAKSSGATTVVVSAPTQSNQTVNNSSSTAAIMDQNLPTVDYNDRSWSFA